MRRGPRLHSPLVRFLHHPAAPFAHAFAAVRALLDAFVPALPYLGGGLLALAATLAALRWLRVPAGRRQERLLELALPPTAAEQGAPLLWGALHDLLRPRLVRFVFGQPQLAFELAAADGATRFRFWLPAAVPSALVERAVEAAWPGTSYSRVSDPEPIERAARLAACELSLSGPDCFPLARPEGGGPLRLLLSQLAGLGPDERALVQIVAQPATARAQARLRAAARRLHAGVPLGRAARLVDLVPLGPPRPARGADPTLAPDVHAVVAKSGRPLFRVAIRIAVAGPKRERRRGQIHALCACFAGFEGRVGLRRHRPFAPRRALEGRRLGRHAFLASLDELAALATLPVEPALPGLSRAGARALLPPPELPRTGGKPLGRSDAGPARPVAITVADARHHIWIEGATGAGKTTGIVHLVVCDAHDGRGAIYVDPKGDGVDDTLARIEPDTLQGPLVVIDPERSRRPVGLNVLQGPNRELVAEHVVGVFRRIYEQSWGPRTDDILRACVLTLARDPRMTLAEIPVCLADPNWRRRLTEPLAREDPVLAGFWRWYDGLSEASRVQAVGPLLNKLRAFLLRRSVRSIVGQEQTSFDLDAVLDGGLLLARLPKGMLGEETSRLLGALLIARVWQQVQARSRLPEQERRDCALYVDEMHNYLALPRSFEDLLAEARGYRLSLCLAHQNLGQLPRPMAEALSANARTKLIFACSPEDARVLERHFAPELSAHDLANLGGYQVACRTLAGGQQTRPFTLRTEPLPPGDPERAQTLRAKSEQVFGRELAQVEQKLRLRQLAPSLRPPDRTPDRPPDPPPRHHPAERHARKGPHPGGFRAPAGIPDKGVRGE